MKIVRFSISNTCPYPRVPSLFNKSRLNVFIGEMLSSSWIETQVEQIDPIMEPNSYREPILIRFKSK
jgi:hypothetical protein